MRRLVEVLGLLACSWGERSPEALLLCYIFTFSFESGLEGISEPGEALQVVLELCMHVLSTQKVKVKLLVKKTH